MVDFAKISDLNRCLLKIRNQLEPHCYAQFKRCSAIQLESELNYEKDLKLKATIRELN